MERKINILFVVTMIAALLLSACSSTTTVTPTTPPTTPVSSTATTMPAAGGMLPEVDPATVSGDIVAAGSSTVYPLAERMAERFQQEGYAGIISIDSVGSGAGFERFCTAGETDISNASRAIKDSEITNCQAIGRTPIEFRIGTDALAIAVSIDNTFLTDITMDELAQIFTDAVKWSDVNPAWPNENILRFSPGTDSGTFDYFVESVLQPVNGGDNTAARNAILNAANIQFSEDDNVLVQGVEGSPYAIGYFGYAYFAENQGKLKVISLNGIAPSFDTAENGTYPISRPLFLYSDAQIMKDKPQVAAYINFFLTYIDEEIQGVGYFPASQDALDTAKQAWLTAMNP